MPIQRSISRIVTPGRAVAGCQKVGHSFIEVIQADDFINSDPFIRLTDDRMEIGDKEIGAPHPHAGFEALGLLLEGAIRNLENGALLTPGARESARGRSNNASHNCATPPVGFP